jgi:hypothetical protein
MSIAKEAQWNFRSAGSNTNGGFFVPGGTGTNYSLQDAAQSTRTDIVANGTTTLTSATGNWTAAMVDNGIYLDNISDWRQIVTYVSAGEITVDATVTTGSGITGNVGGALAVPTDNLYENVLINGNYVYYKGGDTFTFTESVSLSRSAHHQNHIISAGYDAVPGDVCNGTDRPIWAQGASYLVDVPNYFEFHNLDITSTSTSSCIQADVQSVYLNVKATNTNTTCPLGVLRFGGNNAKAIGCEVSAPTSVGSGGIGISGGGECDIVGNYVHDIGGTNKGIVSPISTTTIFNTVDTIGGIGIDSTLWGGYIAHNTLYNCGTGLNITSGGDTVVNNDFNSCTLGIDGDTNTDYGNYNNFYNNTTDYNSDYQSGAGDTADDPNYTDAANGDFSNELSSDNTINTWIMGTGGGGNSLVQGATQPIGAGGAVETVTGHFE